MIGRIHFTEEASKQLGLLKGKTGLTPNVLARIGFCLSLNDPSIPDPSNFPPDGNREIERNVLFGQWEDLIVALLKERCKEDEIDEDKWPEHLKAHFNRGAMLLHKRVKNIEDIARLFPKN